MSLESGHEWIIQNDFTHVQLPLGTWLPIFLDIDWELYLKQTEELSASHPSSDGVYSQQVAHWYHNLKQQLSPLHPLLTELVERQIPNRLCCQFYPENPSHLVLLEEISYLDALQNEQADSPTIQPVFLRGWLKDLLLLFAQLHRTQQQLEQLLDAVMGDVLEKKQHTLNRYAQLKQDNLLYQQVVHLAYHNLSPRFYITSCKKKLSGHTYMVTDDLPSLTLWEFEMVCANEVELRRCHHCGRYFLPFSSVSCYCKRPLPDQPEKTCQDIGAVSKFQNKVNGDAAKELYLKTCNRLKTWVSRNASLYPDANKGYINAQYEAKVQLEQVRSGELEFSEFQKWCERENRVILGLKS